MATPAGDAAARDAGRPAFVAALGTAICTFVLLLAGGTVTSLEAGLAVPDWPTTYGHGMVTTPMGSLTAPERVEHTHRLLGMVVGCCTLLLAASLLRWDRRRSVRVAGGLAVALVIAQGVMGGLRVNEKSVEWAMVHAFTAEVFFMLVVGLAAVTAPGWARLAPVAGDPPAPRRAAHLALVASFAQVVLGIVTRHTGHAPTANVHAGFALVVAALVMAAAGRASACHGVRAVGGLALALTVVQIGLGLSAWGLAFQTKGTDAAAAIVATAHLGAGALMIGALTVLALRSRRLQSAVPEASPAPAIGRVPGFAVVA